MAKRGRVRMELIGGKELQQKLKAMGNNVRIANERAARAAEVPMLNEARAKAPGPYVLALTSKKESTEDRCVVNIGPDKEHWYYAIAEFGAGAHEIAAGVSARREIWAPFGNINTAKRNKRAKAAMVTATANARLAFEGRSGLVITRSVNHPGQAARPFLRPAMKNNREAAQKLAGEVFLAEINRIANGAD